MNNNPETEELIIKVSQDCLKYKSENIFEFIKTQNTNFSYKDYNVTYKKLEVKHIEQLAELHKILFPVKYSKEYFRSIIHNNENIKIGAFIKIENVNYLIGFILVKIYNDYYFNSFISNEEITTNLFNRSFLTKMLFPYKIAYLSTIGVIDEFKRQGISTTLLFKVEKELTERSDILGIMLHVLSYNKKAINLYEKFDYIKASNKSLNHYFINDAYQDAFVYFKLFKDGILKAENELNLFNENKLINILKLPLNYIISLFVKNNNNN